REPGVRVRLEEVELVVAGELDFPRKPAPVPRAERSRTVEDLAERCRRHVTAEIHAVEAEAACNRDVPRSELHEEGSALVPARGLALDELEQRIVDRDARNRAPAKRARRGAGEEIDVREGIELETVAPDPAHELVVLARVPTDLVDDE